jgi:rod shape determining protein RodA
MIRRDYQHQIVPPSSRHHRRTFLQTLHIDAPLLGALAMMLSGGLFVLYSASGEHLDTVLRQATRILAGLIALLVLAQVQPATYRRWTPVLYTAGVTLLIAVLLFGAQSKGAQRWLAIPMLPRFQPSEIMKLVVPMMVAWYLADRTLPPRWQALLIGGVAIALPMGLIARQPDLGTALLIGSSGFIVLFLAGMSWRLLGALGFLSVPGAAITWHFMHEYQRNRVLTFLNPERDPFGTGWNIIQSKTAIGSGGLDGKGWLNGTQAHLDFLPESSTDFIIAVLAEEFGLVGVILLLMGYLLILGRGLYIALQAQDTYNRLVAGTITLTFFVYVFVNIGMVSGLLPVVGVPLPLISYGGTSIVTLLASFGMLMSIHTNRRLLKN